MIGIIDYSAGNLRSIENALLYLKADYKIISTPREFEKVDRIILPGVGAFGFLMDKIREMRIDLPIKNSIASGKPFFGICLGMQVLFEESEESPGVKGLSVFKGKVVRFRRGKVPQIGWNRILPLKQGIFEEGFVYFVNSYFVEPADKEIISTKSDYYGGFASSVQFKNITGVQFHPEKSGFFGLEIINKWFEN